MRKVMPKSDEFCNWTLRHEEMFTMAPYGVMGIVNMSPDSFYDQNRYSNPENGLKHAKCLWQEGAHILDLGAESSRPGAKAISAEEEQKRLMPVLVPLMEEVENANKQAVLGRGEKAPYICVDTYHAETAKAALEAGVHIINDISACVFEPELLEVVAHYKPGYVLMHTTDRPAVMQENIVSDNIVDNVRFFFEFHIRRLIKAGLPEANIVLDLGIGFGKTYEQNLELLNSAYKFQQMGFPVLTAISMKSFLSKHVQSENQSIEKRALTTQILTALLFKQGLRLHRVHHVEDTLCTLHTVQNF